MSAKLAGFRSSDVALMVKAEGDAKFERMPLVTAGDATTFEGMLFDVKKAHRVLRRSRRREVADLRR